jgi:tripartite-type tricarboxylate transporter receptor subunit TctC
MKSWKSSRGVAIAMAAFSLMVFGAEAIAQTYPAKPVRVVVPFAPGGRVEGIARLVANSLQEQLGQPFVVESRAGAGGGVGSDFVAKSPPDGYTLLLNSAGTHAILPNVDSKLPYDPVRDFTPIANLVEGFTFIGAHPSLGARTIADLVALGKARPGTIGFASSGVGTYGHFAGELFALVAGAKLLHVPYRGSGPALNDLSAGHVPLMVAGELVELGKANKIVVLATTNETRSPELPDVPTLKESGYPQFSLHSWIGLVGPANIPADVVAKLNAAVGKAINDPRALSQLRILGVVPSFSSAAGFQARIRADREGYAEIVKKAGLSFQ